MPKKLIEVALPLDDINAASAKEKNPFLKKHPRNFHLWWARRPLAAARAVIFSSLITDPGDPDYPWREGQDHDIETERKRLHNLISQMVLWENSTNERLLNEVRAEIHRHTNGNPPPLLDPFAGGGSIPLEAQRLGLEAHASDLNPVAVLINKAMIEIPPKFAGRPPVNPSLPQPLSSEHPLSPDPFLPQGRKGSMSRSEEGKYVPLSLQGEGRGEGREGRGEGEWQGAKGLAADVRHYGQWMRDEAERRIGHLYPMVTLPKEQGGGQATVIAWLWARTVTCPNPACAAEMPLISSFDISKKKGKECQVVPLVRTDRTGVDFDVRPGLSQEADTVNRKGARCIVCGTAVPFTYIRSEGKRTGLGTQLMAVVAEGFRGRVYVPPSVAQSDIASQAQAEWRPNAELPINPRDFKTPNYGLTTFGDLFTERQLVALTTFSDLVGEARQRVLADAIAAGLPDDGIRLADGGTAAPAYADAVATYLGLSMSRLADLSNTGTSWNSSNEQIRALFSRQAIPMVWDFSEVNLFAGFVGIDTVTMSVSGAFDTLPASLDGNADQADARYIGNSRRYLVSTDPPYYDNIGYADLSDFFYVWLRRSLPSTWPALFQSMLVPKSEELVATPYRFSGGVSEAEQFFENGLHQSFIRMASIQDEDYPSTIYYAYKQAETETRGEGTSGTASTGWETMLEGLVNSGMQITATWPMRTEREVRMVAQDTNALASSVVLACRVREEGAPEISRQQFLRELRQRLAADLRPLQQSSIAPVDLPQAAIGPGMAIYSQYSRVREATGEPLRVRAALALINQVLDEVLAEQDAEYDSATRWAVSWYEQHGMNDGPFGDAENLARARDVAVDEMARDGMLQSGRGKVRFVWREDYPELPPTWQPRIHDVYDWVIMQRLAHAIQQGQEPAAALKATIDRTMPGRTEIAKELAYRIHNIAERKGWTRESLVYNTLVQNWPEIERLARDVPTSGTGQQEMF